MTQPFQCYFCDSRIITWSYPALDFPIPDYPTRGSVGGWAACEDCYRLIEARDKEGLLLRSIRSAPFPGIPGTRKGVRKLHYEFFRHRTGPPQPFTLSIQ